MDQWLGVWGVGAYGSDHGKTTTSANPTTGDRTDWVSSVMTPDDSRLVAIHFLSRDSEAKRACSRAWENSLVAPVALTVVTDGGMTHSGSRPGEVLDFLRAFFALQYSGDILRIDQDPSTSAVTLDVA